MNYSRSRRLKLLRSLQVFAALLFVGMGAAFGQTPETIRKASDSAMPEKQSLSFAEVARKVEPAVVSIDTRVEMPEISFKGDQQPTQKELSDLLSRRPAIGSGFIVDSRGHIVTNYHVVEGADGISVKLQNGDVFEARVLGVDEETDLAVLKIDAGKPLPFVSFGNSDEAKIGEWVLAIGSPFGLARTVTAGIISQTNRSTEGGNVFQKFLQTDAAINRGNSGGPLVDMAGNVIGVNSQIATSTGDYNGIGFALPSNEADYVYRQILAHGKVKRGYLGVFLDSVGKDFAKVYGFEDATGAIIVSIRDRDGAAATAGLRENDIVRYFNGDVVLNAEDLIAKVAATQPGELVEVRVVREEGDKLVQKAFSVRLDERPGANPESDKPTPRKLPLNPKKNELPFGLTLEFVTGKTAEDANFPGRTGLLVTRIDPASILNEVRTTTGALSLQRDDLIIRVNRKPVASLEEFKAFAEKAAKGDPVVLHVLSYDADTGQQVPRIVQFSAK
ncbi:MAG: trypsin-like peptidase domain-containing protein [Pyrinomonadaceae bacterium]